MCKISQSGHILGERMGTGPLRMIDGNGNSLAGHWQYLSKLQMHLPFAPASPLLGIYSSDTLPRVWNDMHSRLFTAGLLVRAKVWKFPKRL